MNSVVFTDKSKRIAAALTHFKHGTPMGEWASDQMEHALSQNPVDYGTWGNFRTTFKDHFILPQTQMEAMQKMHTYTMGNQDFNKWYQVWSTYARQANVNNKTKMFTFRKLIPGPLHNKLLGLSPPPATLSALVEKARDFNTSWRMFARPKTGRGPWNPQVQEIKGEDAPSPNPDINTVGKRPPFKKQGCLSPQERKHCMDKNLYLYCGEASHKAINCTKPPNCHPGGSLR